MSVLWEQPQRPKRWPSRESSASFEYTNVLPKILKAMNDFCCSYSWFDHVEPRQARGDLWEGGAPMFKMDITNPDKSTSKTLVQPSGPFSEEEISKDTDDILFSIWLLLSQSSIYKAVQLSIAQAVVVQ